MSSFRRLFATRYDPSRDLAHSSSFDGWLRFNLQDALGRKEPSPAVWNRIERQLVIKHPLASQHGPRLRTGKWLWNVARIAHMFLTEPCLAERLDERRMEIITEMITGPGSGVLGLAVT